MSKEQFKNILQKLKSGQYQENEIVIASDETPESFQRSMEDDDIILLCEALKNNPHIKTLELFLQRIGDEGAKALAQVDTLEDVSICCGILGVPGGVALARSKLKALTIEGSYIFYDQDDNKIGAEAIEFIEALIENKSIEELKLSDRYIDLDLLIKLIERTTSIKKLYLHKSSFNRELFQDLKINQEEMYITNCIDDDIILLGNTQEDSI